MPLSDEQSDRLQSLIRELDTLASDEEAAEEVLDEIYLLVTTIYERFPNLEIDDE